MEDAHVASLGPRAQLALAESLEEQWEGGSAQLADSALVPIHLVLASLGGVAGVHLLAKQLDAPPRLIRDRLRRAARVRNLGAGYFALVDMPVPPVEKWAEAYLRLAGEISFDEMVQAIMTRFPRGHLRSVEAWLRQEPGRIGLRGTRVFFRDLPPIVL